MDLGHYLGVRDRVEELARTSPAETPVPACPGWRVREVLAHLAGLCQDWAHHRLDGYASDAWTEAQLSRFAGWSVDDILDEWRVAVGEFARLPDDPVMGAPSRWAFGDAVIHEADIRGAVGAARVPGDVVQVALKGSIGRWRQTLRDAGTPTLLLRLTDSRDWWLGDPDAPDAVVAETSAYEVFRALAGRRTSTQFRAWAWTTDPEPFVRAGLPFPFTWAAGPIED